MKSIKNHYDLSMIKDMYQMMEFILWLILIKFVIIEKRYNPEKNIVIMKKGYDNKVVL